MSNIHDLVERGELKAVASLIEEDNSVVNEVLSKTEADQPLHLAAWQNMSEVARLLINNGADVNAVGDSNRVPLHYAAQYGSFEVAKILLDAGVNVDLQDANGFTALLLAVRGREPSCITVAQLLRNSGAYADLNSLVSLGETESVCELSTQTSALQKATEASSLIEDFVIMVEGKILASGFYDADERQGIIVNEYRAMLLCLLKLGAEINAIGSTGYPALFTAVQSSIPSLVRLLLENGADVNYQLNQNGRVTKAMSLTSGDEGKEVRKVLNEYGFKKS